MAKPRKGVMPAALKAYWAKRRGSARKSPTVKSMAKKGSKRGKRRSVGRAALPIIPTIVMTLPEMLVGAKAAIELSQGATPGNTGKIALERLGALYGTHEALEEFSIGSNAKAKASGLILHALARALGMRVRVSKHFTLF